MVGQNLFSPFASCSCRATTASPAKRRTALETSKDPGRAARERARSVGASRSALLSAPRQPPAAICPSLELAAKIRGCSGRSAREPEAARAAGSAAPPRHLAAARAEGRRQVLSPAGVRARTQPTLEQRGEQPRVQRPKVQFPRSPSGALRPPPDLCLSEALSFRIPKEPGPCGHPLGSPPPGGGDWKRGDIFPSHSLLPIEAPLPSRAPRPHRPQPRLRGGAPSRTRPFGSLPD